MEALNKIREWAAAHPKWTLALAVFVALVPFLAKPFNMDDPLFIWSARQIHAHPLNPYGFNVNWYGSAAPMWSITQNPPLAAYYLALAAGILGWSEVALHGAFLLPALAVIFGTYRLARRFCDQPLLAALLTLFTPVFLVSSTTVMCDVLMLAFWVWAVVLWVEGTERNSVWLLAGAGLLVALATLTKYFGACLIPLLAVYSLMSQRRSGRWAVCLLIPVLALCVWQWATHTLYQHNLLSEAAKYASGLSGFFSGARVVTVMTTLTFTGGCVAAAVFFAPWLWRARTLLALAGGVILLSVALYGAGIFLQRYAMLKDGALLFMHAQIVFWAIGGVFVLALGAADLWVHRDARSWLLALWVFGTFVFTAIFNWTINGRSILPMAPAVGILIARRLQQWPAKNKNGLSVLIPLAVSALFAFLVARSDFLLASAVRQSALLTHERYGRDGQTLWFQGHWGFQFYMTELGGRIQDMQQSVLHPGDYLAIPLNNCNVNYPAATGEDLSAGEPRFLTTMNIYIGGGFYSSELGLLPFAFGQVPPENVMVYH